MIRRLAQRVRDRVQCTVLELAERLVSCFVAVGKGEGVVGVLERASLNGLMMMTPSIGDK